MNQLLQAISQYVPVSDELRAELTRRLKPQTFRKREMVFRADQICTHSYFIQAGILRLYYLKDGKEITEAFFSSGAWANSPRSFMQQEPDVYYLDAVEESQVWSLYVKDLGELFAQFREMEEYSRLDMNSTFGDVLDRLSSTRFSTAREKYAHFLQSFPDIHHRIPLGMVASYIGVAAETLSRLRRET